MQVTPHFLANFMNATDASIYRRRIYIDLGIKNYNSSVCWMMQNYPLKFDLMYGFECAVDLSDIPALKSDIDRCITDTEADARGYEIDQVIKTFKFCYNYVGLEDNCKPFRPLGALVNLSKTLALLKMILSS
jgi:hypothetical protein